MLSYPILKRVLLLFLSMKIRTTPKAKSLRYVFGHASPLRLHLLLIPALGLVMTGLSSCTYLKYASIQGEYKRIQKADPSQVNLKHMIDHHNYYVIGKTEDIHQRYSEYRLAISAYSDRFQLNERVDTMHAVTVGTHFGLNLPEGDYELLAFADLNRNGSFEGNEVLGRKKIKLNPVETPENAITHVSLELSDPVSIDWVTAFQVPKEVPAIKSLFYPGNAIRKLEDPIFDPGMATLGMYDPAAFLEKGSTMFYALEEDLGYKTPIVFVHGIGGSPRSFKPLLERLDTDRYKAWFFYYPSGGDLNQLAGMFHKIFLSGKLVGYSEQPMIVIAHSMGGLIVREALNLYKETGKENRIALFASIATPFGGHAASAAGEKHGIIVLPAWRDLNPGNSYIQNLYRKPLPEFTTHNLIYAFQNESLLKTGENSDGVVSLASQLRPEAQLQSSEQFGIDNTHVGILDDPILFDYLINSIAAVKNFYPESHLKVFEQGGWKLPTDEDYDPIFRYTIEKMGHYVDAVYRGKLETIAPDQDHFYQASHGQVPPTNDFEKDWIKYIKSLPEDAR